MRQILRIALAAATVTGVLAPAATAQPAAPVGKGQVILSWDEFVKITGYDPAKKPGEQGQMITVPWAEVESLLGVKVEKIGKATVDLPWQDFKKLLEWSVNRKAPKPEAPPPADYIVTSANYAGALSADGARWTLTAKIQVLRKDGWKRIPILPAAVAVTKATLPPNAFLNAADGNYEILTEQPGALDVTVEFSVAVSESAGINRVSFQPVLPGASVVDVKVDRENVDVKVAAAQSLAVKSDKGVTAAAAALPGGTGVDVSWERALPKVAKAPTKLYAETRTLVSVAEGVLLGQETVHFNILHSPVRELKLQVPAGASVLEVIGAGVQDWRVDDKGALVVVLGKETIGSCSLRVAFESPADDAVDAPVLRALDVQREKGYVGVAALANVEISSAGAAGATRIDVRQLPADIAAMTNQPILLAFRYVTDDFTVPLAIKKHQAVAALVTVIDSALFRVMQLNDGRRMTKAVYSVRNNRNQFLRLKIPKETEIWSVTVAGKTVSVARDEADGSILTPLVRSSSASADLASFPVELVYVRTPAEAVPPAGVNRVELPVCAVPALHVMVEAYLPAEGTYTGGWNKPGFTGALKLVDEFTSLSAARGAVVVHTDAAKDVAGMQQQFDQRADAQAVEAGATPIRVSLPINGKRFLLEKILALPGDHLYFDVAYRGWKPAT